MKKLSLYVFLVLMFCNTAIAKDLNGTKLYCFHIQNDGMESEAALAFIENNYVKFGHMNSYLPNKIIYLKNLVVVANYQYEVTEDYIIIDTSTGGDSRYNIRGHITKLHRKQLQLHGGGGKGIFFFSPYM